MSLLTGLHLATVPLRHSLTSAPVLAFPDPDKPFELVFDASGFSLGVVLLQEGGPLG